MKVFNRQDPETIKYALEHTLEEFVEHYIKTSATEKTLREAYNEIVKDKAVSKIGASSGKSEAGKPLKPVHYTQNEQGEIEVIDTTNIPTRKDLDDAEFTEDGRVIKKVEKKEEEKVEVKEKKTSKKQVVEKEKGEKKESKRDIIKSFFEEDPEITNKAIKERLKKRGIDKCYDSEILSVKKQFKNE